MPSNPKTSKWRSTSNELRKRKARNLTLSDEAWEKADRLVPKYGGSRSEVVENLILEAEE